MNRYTLYAAGRCTYDNARTIGDCYAVGLIHQRLEKREMNTEIHKIEGCNR